MVNYIIAIFGILSIVSVIIVLVQGVCKKLRDLLDAMLLLGNTLMIQKNTTCSRYVILGLAKLEPDMSYDT